MPTYDVTPRFEKDYARLSADDRERFRQAVAKLIEDLRRGQGFRPGLRVDGVEGARGVFEMTWAGDGRATFQYGKSIRPGEAHVVWRRVGYSCRPGQPLSRAVTADARTRGTLSAVA